VTTSRLGTRRNVSRPSGPLAGRRSGGVPVFAAEGEGTIWEVLERSGLATALIAFTTAEGAEAARVRHPEELGEARLSQSRESARSPANPATSNPQVKSRETKQRSKQTNKQRN
jgi:hypothetical protein